VRATLRLLAVPATPQQVKRPVIVLNRLGVPGGLARRQVEDALSQRADVVIPDQPRQLSAAAALGELAIEGKGGFQSGILDLARQVGFTGMLDSAPDHAKAANPAGGKRLWPFARKAS
jgi:hypothetical protein